MLKTANKVEIKVTANLFRDHDKMAIQLATDVNGQVVHKIINLEEKATIDALMRLGWKPPRENYPNLLELALDYIEKSPCDPDITNEQAQAWIKLQDALEQKEKNSGS